ncbi:MAG: aromatic-ring-hydroxylating dioxygenase subunit beta [Alphaproteobacteria bacterium]
MDTNTAQVSHYIDDGFYAGLTAAFTGWQADDAEITDPARRDEFRRLLEREARLLEQDRHTDWLGMYAAECLYWVPASADGGDPRREVAIAFDDRRRLEDRVYRLGTDYAWSQQPVSRTSRIVSNVAAFGTADDAVVMTRSNFLITEFQAGDYRSWAGWNGHRLRRAGGGWEVLVKQVNLINYDQNLRNPSITL